MSANFVFLQQLIFPCGESFQKQSMRILLFDNYDSFTYNLVHMLEAADPAVKVDVVLNDQTDYKRWNDYDKIVISPGPGLPEESGHLLSFIAEVEGKKPILGVCLGLQAIVVHHGGTLLNLDQVLHGVGIPTRVVQPTEPVFAGLGPSLITGRYHSWVANPETLPAVLEVVATDDAGNIMAVRHRLHDTVALQFHPESVLTPDGSKILSNWIKT